MNDYTRIYIIAVIVLISAIAWTVATLAGSALSRIGYTKTADRIVWSKRLSATAWTVFTIPSLITILPGDVRLGFFALGVTTKLISALLELSGYKAMEDFSKALFSNWRHGQ